MSQRPKDSTRPVVDFDHHSQGFAQHSTEVYDELRSRCPVAWTEAHGGFWVVTDYADLAKVARDDETFSSFNDGKQFRGITIPGNPNPSGMIETDPPRFHAVRRAMNPFFSPSAVERMRPEIEHFVTYFIDQFIERGTCDLASELASPVPAVQTLRMLGIPLEEWEPFADAMHRGIYTPPDHPDRPETDALLRWVQERLVEEANARRGDPREGLISFLANLEIDGELMPLDEVRGNANLLLAGGVDTTTALMLNTLIHLQQDPAARAWLMEDESRMEQACEEYLRYFTPVQGLSRTATQKCPVGDQTVEPYERVWLSWGAANRDPQVFDGADELRLDRFPNRHTAFGLGAHRCIGSNLARAIWRTTIREVFRRLPDYEIDLDRTRKYTSIGVVNGWENVPARFTPGAREGSGVLG